MTETDRPDNEQKSCPQCGEVLEEGKALSLSSMLIGAAYLCERCKVIYTRDLELLARMM